MSLLILRHYVFLSAQMIVVFLSWMTKAFLAANFMDHTYFVIDGGFCCLISCTSTECVWRRASWFGGLAAAK